MLIPMGTQDALRERERQHMTYCVTYCEQCVTKSVITYKHTLYQAIHLSCMYRYCIVTIIHQSQTRRVELGIVPALT